MPRTTSFQYKETFSINRENFLRVVVRKTDLSKKDLRVLMHLMTFLDYNTYKEVSRKNIADDLCLSKSDVSNSIENLVYEDVISIGSTQSTKNGLKLMF